MKRIVLSLIFLFVTLATAGVSILEKSPGKIRIRLTADPIVAVVNGDSTLLQSNCPSMVVNGDKQELPSFNLSIFTAQPEKAKISISVLKKSKLSLKKPLKQVDSDIITLNSGAISDLSSSRMRNILIHSWEVTPVLSLSKSSLTQFTEAEVTITYPEVRNSSFPVGEYYQGLAQSTLNPDEFFVSYSRKPSPRAGRGVIDGDRFLSMNERALMFTIGGEPGEISEADGSVDRVVKIIPSMLTQLGTNISFSKLAVFSSNPDIFDSITPGSDELPDALLPVPIIRLDKNKDGYFNGNDEIYFYASGTNYWYNKSGSREEWEFKFNAYSEKRHYYITTETGGVGMPNMTPLTGTPTAVDSAGQLLTRFKESKLITTDLDGLGRADKDWIWKPLKKADPTFTSLALPSLFAPDTTETFEMKMFSPQKSISATSPYLTFAPSVERYNISTGDFSTKSDTGKWHSLPVGTEKFTLTIDDMTSTKLLDFAHYDLRYFTKLTMTKREQLRFYSRKSWDSHKLVNYEVKDLPVNFTLLFRINAYKKSIQLIDTVSVGGTVTWMDSLGKGYEYVVATSKGALTPNLTMVSAQTNIISSTYQVRDLHNKTNRSDYMIVTPVEFVNQSIALAALKKKTLRFTNPTVVTTEDIYREFSGGIPDPCAIRNFMVYVENNWTASRAGADGTDYLLLMGIGHCDYKGINSDAPNYIYPYITTLKPGPTAVEDFYGYLTPRAVANTRYSSKPSIAVGRIPARTADDVDAYLAKLEYMEGGEGDYSEWRNRVLLVSDDDVQNEKVEDIRHTTQSDLVGVEILDSSATTNLKKVTLFEYQRNGYLKPAAKTAYFNYINDGVGLTNYFGHGAYHTMADEKILHISDLSSLQNKGRYFIFSAFSCSVGFFDIPGVPALASELVTRADKGAVASISSTRTSYATGNEKMAIPFFGAFYSSSANNSIGTAYVIAKEKHNLPWYAILGDPSYRPLSTDSSITIDILNEESESIDTMEALQRVTLRAVMPQGHHIDSIRIQLENPEQHNIRRKDGLSDKQDGGWDVKYSLPGATVMNRVFPVVGDSLNVKITIPLPVHQMVDTIIVDSVMVDSIMVNGIMSDSMIVRGELVDSIMVDSMMVDSVMVDGVFVDSVMVDGIMLDSVMVDSVEMDTSCSKLRVYGWANSGSKTVTAVKKNLYFDGTDYSNLDTTDKTGPSIVIQLAQDTSLSDTALPGAIGNRVVIDGFKTDSIDLVAQPAQVELYFSDSSGIDIFGEAPGEGITVSIKNVRTSKNHNSDFKAIDESANKGKVTLLFTPDEFPQPGEYELTVTANDFLQNSSSERFIIEVRSLKQEMYNIGDFYAYPSPAHLGESTRFYFNTPNDGVHRMTLKIFTLSGQLVRQFNDVQPGVRWDLTDQRGNRLSPNVYLYRLYVERDARVTGNSFNSNGESEKEIINSSIRKMVIYPPR